MSGIPITFACGLYDRTLALYTGDVRPKGIDLHYNVMDAPREIFDQMSGTQAFDASEMSCSEFYTRFSAKNCPFVGIPVFTSRMFRHGFVVINRHAGINTPKDLEGKRIAVPIYTATAAVYIRAMLQHDYGVDLKKIRWMQGDMDKSGKHGNPSVLPLLADMGIEQNPTDKSLNTLLEENEIQGTLGPTVPPALTRRHPDIVRLFPNYHEVELEYYTRTRIYPIMHMVVIRRELYEKHPFIAASLYEACCQAKKLAFDRMRYRGAAPCMLPWLRWETEEMVKLFGDDIWPYGIEANRVTLEAFGRYLTEQSMISSPVAPDELFVPVE